MYKKYFRNIIKPLLIENGYLSEKIGSIKNFKKRTETGFEIFIDMQKNKYYPCITINVSILQIATGIFVAGYRLGDFGPYSARDIWWSIEISKIEKSFQEISSIMKETLFRELKKWESPQFIDEFLQNEQIENEIGYI